MEVVKIISATSSIIFPLIFLVLLQTQAKTGMTISYLITIVLSYLVWGLSHTIILASSLEGTIKALSIIYILFGAIFLLNILRKSGAIDVIITGFENITSDKRVLLILIGFYFVALLEGASGFGAPAAIAAPLLVILGFSPVAAASLSLIGNAVPMSFGAVGTPLIDGMGAAIKLNDDQNITDFIREVAINITYVDLFVGSLIPVVMVFLYTTIFSKEKSLRYTLEILPFAFVSGLIYTSLAFLTTNILGVEFGALIASLLGLVVMIFMIRFKILIPKSEPNHKIFIPKKTLIKAWAPYLIVVLLLILSRILIPLRDFLKIFTLHFDNFFGSPIGSKFELLYSPGFVLTFTALLVIFFYKIRKSDVNWAIHNTLTSAKKTTLALVPALAMVYVFLNSGYNTNDLLGMPYYLAFKLSDIFKENWVFISPFIGNLGTFISGSSTTSNIMFSQIQYEVALQNQINPVAILSSQAIGANTGAMISVSKVVSACAVVNLSGEESKVMRVNIGVSLLYAFFIGLMVYVLLL